MLEYKNLLLHQQTKPPQPVRTRCSKKFTNFMTKHVHTISTDARYSNPGNKPTILVFIQEQNRISTHTTILSRKETTFLTDPYFYLIKSSSPPYRKIGKATMNAWSRDQRLWEGGSRETIGEKEGHFRGGLGAVPRLFYFNKQFNFSFLKKLVK